MYNRPTSANNWLIIREKILKNFERKNVAENKVERNFIISYKDVTNSKDDYIMHRNFIALSLFRRCLTYWFTSIKYTLTTWYCNEIRIIYVTRLFVCLCVCVNVIAQVYVYMYVRGIICIYVFVYVRFFAFVVVRVTAWHLN